MHRLPPPALIYPIMGPVCDKTDFEPVDLSPNHLKEQKIENFQDLEDYLDEIRQSQNVQWLIGGYLEQRALYTSDLFEGSQEEKRDIHLGVDIWGPARSPIYCPYPGDIFGWAYNGNALDYGYTLILKHQYANFTFYTLYGHLGPTYQDLWEKGGVVEKGEIIADLGFPHENGGWIPHLHFQIIIDLEGNRSVYPGVCSSSRKEFYRQNCPDPNILIKKAPSS